MWTQSTTTEYMHPLNIPAFDQAPIPTNAAIFDAAWNALRFPGMRHSVSFAPMPVRGLYPATAALCHTLLSIGRTIWIDQAASSPLYQWCLWHTDGFLAPSLGKADFTLVTCPSRIPALYDLNIGDGRDPATATTLFIQVPALDPYRESLWNLKDTRVSPQNVIPGLPQTFWRQRVELQEMLPWGIDIFFIHDNSFVALPRSVFVEAA